jgi:hypothetical protein
MVKRKFLVPFKEGDRIVYCPAKTICGRRGKKGVVTSINSNMAVEVQWDSAADTNLIQSNAYYNIGVGARCQLVAAYSIRKEEECATCACRLMHTIGASCPVEWSEVEKIQEEGNKEIS